ncbi:MAG: prohibitin family protein [Candidatus Palauibacterales bacterium]|jgi:prohibitin 1|nr:prohibitin family protein [Candidatus Palauibacterales bacterium]MDP2483022.1 prohibitin family protein [Candidatus Palauibacterales bacterium]
MIKKLLQQAGTVGAGIAIVMVVLLFLFGFNRVDEFEVGVRRNPVTGAVSPQPYRQGLYHSILRSWTNYSTREIQYPREGAAERLTALSSDQLQIGVDAAYRYKINPDSVVDLYLSIGTPSDIHAYVYNTYRSSVRDAIAEVVASNILSSDRATIGDRIETLMAQRLDPRGILVTDFFVREIEPPETIRQAIENKLSREQQVQAEAYQTQVVQEQANQKRAEAAGIRDAQEIIAASLTGVQGQRYLYWRYLEVLGEVGAGDNNLVIAPTEGGVPIFFTPDRQ